MIEWVPEGGNRKRERERERERGGGERGGREREEREREGGSQIKQLTKILQKWKLPDINRNKLRKIVPDEKALRPMSQKEQEELCKDLGSRRSPINIIGPFVPPRNLHHSRRPIVFK